MGAVHVAICALLLLAGAASAAKPNILLIVADDLGYNDVDFQTPNNSVVLTPHLREMAMGGVRFENHHVQPFCSPTRATIMTGRHVLRYGLQNTVIWPQDAWALPENETFLSENLQDAGYYTGQLGKWHLGLYKPSALPRARGYNEQYGYYLGGEDYWTHERNGGLDWHRNGTLETGDNGTYSANLLGAAAVDFVERGARRGQPWFLYLPFQSVHSPMEAPQKYLDMYPQLQGNVKIRAAMVTAMDDQIGLVLQALKDTQQLSNTVVVFTADNGAPYGDAFDMGDDPAMMQALPFSSSVKPDRPPSGMHGPGGGSNYPKSGWKHWVFEGGVTSASFVYAPGRLANPGSVHYGLFHSVDWLPTLVNLAGGSTARNLPLDGMDIWAAIQSGGRASPHTELPVQITACGPGAPSSIVDGPGAAMIVGDLKLILDCYWRDTKKVDTAQLYNITADIAEEHNLAAARPADVQRLLGRLAFWEAQSLPPYPVNQTCGEGKPTGTPPHWAPWC